MANSTSQTDRLAQLRQLAQHHLTEIESDKVQEQVQLSQAETEIQRYSKMSSFGRKKLQSTNSSNRSGRRETSPDLQHAVDDFGGTPKQRFRPFNEILHRLRWDPKLNIDDYIVGYLERFEGVKEVSASSWIRDFSDEEWIPMHRVRYVKRVRISQEGAESDEEGPELGMVWDRDGRIDKITKGGEFNTDAASTAPSPDDVLSVDGTSVTGGMEL